MIHYDLGRARTAVEFLVETPYFPHRVKGLRTHVQQPRAMPYKGTAEPLNELLVIGRQSMQAMENLIAVAELKRSSFTRVDYQREYMAQSRARHRLAIQLEERRTGRRMDLDERTQYAHEVQAIWMKEREEYLARRKEQFQIQFKEIPGHEDVQAFTKQFWETKTAELNAMLAEPVSQEHNIRKNKRTVVVRGRHASDTSMGEAFNKLLDNRKT